MQHAAILRRLNAQRIAMSVDAEESVTSSAKRIAMAIGFYAAGQSATGTMSKNITEVSEVSRPTFGVYTVGVGNLDKIGDENSAPEGTIAQFLADNKDEINRERRKAITESRLSGKKGGGKARFLDRHTKGMAWWNLPKTMKDKLQNERAMGRYGGDKSIGEGKSPYFYVQEGSKTGTAAHRRRTSVRPCSCPMRLPTKPSRY